MRLLLAALVLAATACRTGGSDKSQETDTAGIDAGDPDEDGDGYPASEDCDDGDEEVNAGAMEVCDGVDNDCDGETDEGVTNTWYTDADDDSYGDPLSPVEACGAPAGTTASGSDCDDSNSDVHPGALELCDGIDNDCDGEIDEDEVFTWYADGDGDGFGDPDAALEDCAWPEGTVSDDSDCDDTRADVNPDATEVCDEADNDCDGAVDEGVTTTYYQDADGDGYGESGTTDEACAEPAGYAGVPGDCDDGDEDVNPAASEVCNGADDDCDGSTDEADAADSPTWYADDDGDGYGDASAPTIACEAPSGTVADASDCDDTTGEVNPAATEVCNGVDDDCDGATDDDDSSLDSATASTWYADGDGDGYGDAAASTRACEAPPEHCADASDCDDDDDDVNPDATEVCDGTDNDCDGATDDADPDLDTGTASTWYTDHDGDGYGDAARGKQACTEPSGTTRDASDCDDRDAAVNPAATEVCDGIDNDCDGDTDDDDSDLDTTTTTTWYEDDDSDGYGDAGSKTRACDEPSGYTDDDSDCDDGDPDVNPGAGEDCDAIDNDCSGDVDDGGTCLCAVESHGSSTYMFCASASDWSAASATCAAYGYHLVTIDDSAESSWLVSTAAAYGSNYWWLGYNDQASEGTWVWEDGSSTSTTNWCGSEPNNSHGWECVSDSQEDCAMMNWGSGGCWNDYPCACSKPYAICEAP